MLLSLASAKGAPGTTTSAHVLAAVWPVPILLVDADPAGSDLIYRLRADNGLPLDAERGLLSLAAAMRNNPDAPVEEHTTLVDGGLDVLLGMPRVPGSPSLPVALSSDALLLVVRAGVDSYAHLRDRLRWVAEETARRAERPDLGVLLVAPWRHRHEAGDLQRLLRSSGVDVPVVGALAFDRDAADSLAGRRPHSLRRSLLVRSARSVVSSVRRPADAALWEVSR